MPAKPSSMLKLKGSELFTVVPVCIQCLVTNVGAAVVFACADLHTVSLLTGSWLAG